LPRGCLTGAYGDGFRVTHFWVSLHARPSAVPWDGYSSCLESRIPRLRHELKAQVAPNLFPLALPSWRLRVAPNPAQTAGSTMVPRQSSNFASPACAADESSHSAGSCAFLPDPGCSFNLFRPSASASRRRTSRFNCALHRPVRLEVRFQIPTGSPALQVVGSSIGPFSLTIWDRCRHRSRIFRWHRRCICGLPRGCCGWRFGRLRFGLSLARLPSTRVLQLCRGMDIRVASNHASLGLRFGLKARVASNLFPSALPSGRLRVAPNPASTAGSTMVPRQSSNFASPACRG
jgi:hypothetical protein